MQHAGAFLVKQIDKDVQEDEGRKKGRTHLGASVLGRKCLRQIWYGWRWAHVVQHQGRLLRLFGRGHREEPHFIRLLTARGFIVRSHAERLCYYSGQQDVPRYLSVPWDAPIPEYYEDVSQSAAHLELATEEGRAPKQLGFSDHMGHFGGSGDGMLLPGPGGVGITLPDGPGLAEYKTAGDKAFVDLAGKLEDWRKHVTDPVKNPFTGKGVISSKIEHYVQMQTYMKYFGLKWALYVVVNKNTDDLYIEVVHYKPEVAEAYSDRAGQIILARRPPARITSDPSWWECKFCDYREICHRNAPLAKNCRSCVYSDPVEGGVWACSKYHQPIPKDFMPKGCDSWEVIAE